MRLSTQEVVSARASKPHISFTRQHPLVVIDTSQHWQVDRWLNKTSDSNPLSTLAACIVHGYCVAELLACSWRQRQLCCLQVVCLWLLSTNMMTLISFISAERVRKQERERKSGSEWKKKRVHRKKICSVYSVLVCDYVYRLFFYLFSLHACASATHMHC